MAPCGLHCDRSLVPTETALIRDRINRNKQNSLDRAQGEESIRKWRIAVAPLQTLASWREFRFSVEWDGGARPYSSGAAAGLADTAAIRPTRCATTTEV